MSALFSIEGELVRRVWDYEYDYFSIDGRDIAAVFNDALGGGTREDIGRTEREFRYGHVRLTIEVIR